MTHSRFGTARWETDTTREDLLAELGLAEAAVPALFPDSLDLITARTEFYEQPAALLLGLIFGVAVGPCTFAYMAPMLGVTFRVASTRLLYAIALLLAYGLGHCAVIVAAGASTELVQRYLNWNEQSKGTIVVKRICGALVLLAGLYLLYRA